MLTLDDLERVAEVTDAGADFLAPRRETKTPARRGAPPRRERPSAKPGKEQRDDLLGAIGFVLATVLAIVTWWWRGWRF